MWWVSVIWWNLYPTISPTLVAISYVQSHNVSFDPLIVRETHSPQILGRRNLKTVGVGNIIIVNPISLIRWKSNYGKKCWQSVFQLLCRMQLLFHIRHLLLRSTLNPASKCRIISYVKIYIYLNTISFIRKTSKTKDLSKLVGWYMRI